MELLLDTNVLLWTLFDDEHLSKEHKSLIMDESNDVFVSIASLWEIEIKHCKNPSLMPYSMKEVFNVITGGTDFGLLGLTPKYLLSLHEIIEKEIHNDPFDHIILSTAKCEKMKLLTTDQTFEKYKDLGISMKVS